jgi:hypothetical protein
MAVFIFTALLANDDNTKTLCYRALELFAVWPLLTTGLVCLASGVVLGLGTKYGLVRYWWVAIKLVLNILLTALVPIALRPEVSKAAEQGRQFAAGEPASLVVGNPDLSADRFPDRPAHCDGVGSVQAMGANT